MAGQEAVRVYVVDDEPVIAITVCTILARAGFEAKAFFHPADLLREAALCHPQVVLSDVMMPEMNGLDLSLRLQMDHPECKVVLFSGHVETLELLEAARAHGHEFEVLTKPVRPEDLLVRLRSLVGDRQPVLAA